MEAMIDFINLDALLGEPLTPLSTEPSLELNLDLTLGDLEPEAIAAPDPLFPTEPSGTAPDSWLDVDDRSDITSEPAFDFGPTDPASDRLPLNLDLDLSLEPETPDAPEALDDSLSLFFDDAAASPEQDATAEAASGDNDLDWLAAAAQEPSFDQPLDISPTEPLTSASTPLEPTDLASVNLERVDSEPALELEDLELGDSPQADGPLGLEAPAAEGVGLDDLSLDDLLTLETESAGPETSDLDALDIDPFALDEPAGWGRSRPEETAELEISEPLIPAPAAPAPEALDLNLLGLESLESDLFELENLNPSLELDVDEPDPLLEQSEPEPSPVELLES
jgi:hypothetical protein